MDCCGCCPSEAFSLVAIKYALTPAPTPHMKRAPTPMKIPGKGIRKSIKLKTQAATPAPKAGMDTYSSPKGNKNPASSPASIGSLYRSLLTFPGPMFAMPTQSPRRTFL